MLDNYNKAGGGAGLPTFHQTSAAAIAMPSRDRFYVELKPGETTFISWKKLLKDSQKTARAPSPSSEAPAGAHPALEARIAPEVVKEKDPLPPPPNRFNSVIERIERLYQGGNSDNELSDYLDDDKYDTRDSFIDDAELDDYFSVEDAKLKHKGFFVNRGKLEQETEPPPSSVAGAKKRKRKDIKKLSTESNEEESKKLTFGVRLKAAARKVPSPSAGLPSSFDVNTSIQKERKEVRDPLFGWETGKGTAVTVVGSELISAGANSMVVSGCLQDVVRDKIDGKELSEGVAVDRPMVDRMFSVNSREQATGLFDVNEPLERDTIVSLEQRETSTTNGTKTKAVQRATKDEDLKETLVGAKKPPPLAGKEVSPGRAKGTVLERAFLDLEKGVAELCPPSLVVREPEQGKRNRLPRDIKQKLAKVARLAAKQGRITDELIERLMGILGHVMRVKTLKRNLKAMIEMGLSAMQEKEGRLQGIKKEVTEMIKSRVHKLQAQDVRPPDDLQLPGASPEKASAEGRYQWDHATEDKICDLYEEYIEGLDENKGPHLRKLYAELAELWPDGWMDNIGIKLAVHRAKERKKQLSKASNSADAKKRRRPVVKPKMEDLGGDGETVLQVITPGGHGQSPFEKISTYEHEVHLSHGHEVRLSMEEKKKHTSKPGSVERKSKTTDASPPSKKKIKREVDKGGVAATDMALVLLNKSFSTQDAFVGSTVASMPPSETPLWNMDTHYSMGGTRPPNE